MSGAAMSMTALQAWLDAYARAWEEGDAEAAAALFTEDAVYRETPFDEAFRGRTAIRAYWAEGSDTQRAVAVSCTALAVVVDLGMAHWHATFTRIASDVDVELDGVFVLRFDQHGLCRELLEWWHRREEPGEPEGRA